MNNLIKIAPSILSGDFSKLGDEIKKLDQSTADYIHIDVMDGHFVPNLTFGAPVIKSFRKYSNKIFDVHLMISEPEKYIKDFVDAGADIIGIHEEIKADKIEILKLIKNFGKEACITYNPDTDISNVEKYFPYVRQILLMSVFPGFGGQKFIESTLEKGQEIRRLIDKSEYEIDLQIDGGVSKKNSTTIIEHGFNVLVSGSSIFNAPDFNQMIIDLRK